MGILRQEKSQAAHPSLDPFEIYDDLSIDHASFLARGNSNTRSDDSQKKVTAQSDRKVNNSLQNGNGSRFGAYFRSIARARLSKVITFGSLAAFTVFVTSKVKPWTYFSQPNLEYAYFEVRALDSDGRPIAGAVVKNAGKRVGTTDSFGEWRRYMRVPLGATIPITLAKKSVNQVLYATKNFAVPPQKPEKSEIELRSSVQLLVANLGDVQAETAATASPNDLMSSQNGKAKSNENDVALRTLQNDLFKLGSSDQTVKPTHSSVSASSLGSLETFREDHNAVWFEASDPLAEGILKEVLPALVKRASEIGLKVERNAAWQVKLNNILPKPAILPKDGGGLILISFNESSASGNRQVSFLRNYQKDARTTARSILFGLVTHAKKDVIAQRKGERWVAILSKTSPSVWELNPKTVLKSADRSVFLTGESFSDNESRGFYIKSSKESPCRSDANSCVLQTASIPDTPPVQGWRQLRVKISGVSKEGQKVFISGYEATPLADNVYQYWGQGKVRANVTLLKNNSLLARGFTIGDEKGSAFIGVSNLTQR